MFEHAWLVFSPDHHMRKLFGKDGWNLTRYYETINDAMDHLCTWQCIIDQLFSFSFHPLKKVCLHKTDSWSFLFSRLLCQIVQAIVDYQLWCYRDSLFTFSLGDIPLLAWLLVSLSLMLVVVVNEVVKLHEIRYNCRHKTKLKWENIHSKWQIGYINEMFNAC